MTSTHTTDTAGPNELAAAFGKELSLSSRAVHADDYINNHQAVAPPLHVSTTFRYSRNPDELKQWENLNASLPYPLSSNPLTNPLKSPSHPTTRTSTPVTALPTQRASKLSSPPS